MSPRTRPRPGWAPFLAAALLSLAACGEDSKKPSDTGDTSDTQVDVEPDVAACEGLAGTLGCPCREDQSCDGDLACTAGTCQALVTTGLVLPAGARGCEILLAETDRVSEVRFASGVRGTFVREAPRVAIAVVQATDADFAAGAVEVIGTGSPIATVVTASCVDTNGAVLPDAAVTLR